MAIKQEIHFTKPGFTQYFLIFLFIILLNFFSYIWPRIKHENFFNLYNGQ